MAKNIRQWRSFPLAAAVLLVALLAPSASAQYIYVANAGEDSVSKIDINTNTEVARYATWFTSGTNHVPHLNSPTIGPAPSRLLEDLSGNLFVLNRFFSPAHRPVLMKIAPTGGTPNVTTSGGSTALPIIDSNSSNNIDPGEAQDVRILWAKEIGAASDVGALGRALCMDSTGVLWVGMYITQRYYRVDPATGQMLPPLAGIPTPGHRPYGCQGDTQGRIWSVDGSKTLAEINTNTNLVTVRNHGTPTDFGTNYAVSLFNGCGSTPTKVYLSNRPTNTYIVYDTQTGSFSNAPLTGTNLFSSWAIGVDLNGNIVSGQQSATGRVIKTNPSGSVIWDTSLVGSTVVAADQHGAIVDGQNNIWMVHLQENRVVKYNGLSGQVMATVPVGNRPYTYGNPPPPSCPCAEVLEPRLTCEKQSNGIGTYAFTYTFVNHSPFATPATAIDMSSSQATNITPAHFQFPTPVPPNGQATVTGTFSVANPVPGTQVCLDVRLNAGEGWCCPMQRVCFVLPECPECAKLQGVFKCQHGQPFLQLSVTNQGPTIANSMTVFSTTAGVTVNPSTITQTFPQNVPVQIPLLVTGAAPGQTISLSVSLNGPIDPKTGFNDWCCTSTVTVVYPKKACPTQLGGLVFNDLNGNGLRDSVEEVLTGWTATLTDEKGTSHTTLTDANGIYRFEDVETGTYRIAVQPSRGWRSTQPVSGVHAVTVGDQSQQQFDFGFVKAQP